MQKKNEGLVYREELYCKKKRHDFQVPCKYTHSSTRIVLTEKKI